MTLRFLIGINMAELPIHLAELPIHHVKSVAGFLLWIQQNQFNVHQALFVTDDMMQGI